jgi:release factor glutamine methyltransferase
MEGGGHVSKPVEVEHGWIVEAQRRLADAGIASPEREVAALTAYARRERGWADFTPNGDELAALFALVAQRCAHVPLERLIGWAEFRHLQLLVGPGVFVPQPETSCVVDWAVEAAGRQLARGLERVLCVDLCSGAGTIALSLAAEISRAVVHAVEFDSDALSWAARNAAHNGLDVQMHHADALHALPELNGQVDVVTSNPPYVATSELVQVRPEVREHDPAVALHAGTDGLDVIRIVERAARRLLRTGGAIVVEHSDRQGRTAPEVFANRDFWLDITDHRDEEGLDRFVTATRR